MHQSHFFYEKRSVVSIVPMRLRDGMICRRPVMILSETYAINSQHKGISLLAI